MTQFNQHNQHHWYNWHHRHNWYRSNYWTMRPSTQSASPPAISPTLSCIAKAPPPPSPPPSSPCHHLVLLYRSCYSILDRQYSSIILDSLLSIVYVFSFIHSLDISCFSLSSTCQHITYQHITLLTHTLSTLTPSTHPLHTQAKPAVYRSPKVWPSTPTCPLFSVSTLSHPLVCTQGGTTLTWQWFIVKQWPSQAPRSCILGIHLRSLWRRSTLTLISTLTFSLILILTLTRTFSLILTFTLRSTLLWSNLCFTANNNPYPHHSTYPYPNNNPIPIWTSISPTLYPSLHLSIYPSISNAYPPSPITDSKCSSRSPVFFRPRYSRIRQSNSAPVLTQLEPGAER